VSALIHAIGRAVAIGRAGRRDDVSRLKLRPLVVKESTAGRRTVGSRRAQLERLCRDRPPVDGGRHVRPLP
jgi:hypothetical protein